MATPMIALIQSDYDFDYFHVSQMIAKIQLNDCSDDNSGDVHSSDYDCQQTEVLFFTGKILLALQVAVLERNKDQMMRYFTDGCHDSDERLAR